LKQFKTLTALVLALMMVFSVVGTALASDPTASGDSGTTTTTTYDHPLTVTGLATGDTVKFYQVIKWVGETSDKSDVSGWKAVSPFDTYLTKDRLTEILVGTKADNTVDPPVAAKDPTGITSEIAGELAKLATGGVDGEISGTTATLDNAASGMWMALITPADANTIYNPVFVSADYNKDAAGTVATSATLADTVAKKSTITLTKTATNASDYNSDNAKTTAVGDVVTFTVNTQIPAYGSVYTTPHFDVVDTLVDLALKADTVKVSSPALNKDTDYTVDATTSGYRISFTATYLKSLTTATPITITYDAEVTSSAAKAINEESNDVYIEYSHNPNEQSDYDVKKDTTQHYTFSLDAAGLGAHQSVEGLKTSELVKTAVDAAGNPIKTETQTSAITKTETWEGPLEGAQFGLWKNENCSGEPYKTATTTADGRMNFAGLDAGNYWLKEISAPDGYVTNTAVHPIVITAVTESVKVTEYWNGSTWVSEAPASGTSKPVTYDTDILKSYSVSVDGTVKDTYTFTNEETANNNEIKWTTLQPVEKPSELVNTKGVELPSTGGIGTTIFYIAGIVMVLGAAAIVVARRKAEQE